MMLKKKDLWKFIKEKRKAKRSIYQSKNEVNEQDERKLNQVVG